MATEFWKAPDEILTIAKGVIDRHHEDLVDVGIAYLMRSPTAKRNGQEVWGAASKANAKQQALAGEDIRFIIELSSEVWDQLSPIQRCALIDHELCHCTQEIDENGEVHYRMCPHDLEEFNDIVGRYGRWNDGVQLFAEQLELPHLHAVGE